MAKTKEKKIHFNEIPIPKIKNRPQLKKIFWVAEGDDSEVWNVLFELKENKRIKIIELITNMATVKDFKSDSVNWNFKKYKYGEISPKPQRFFFFQEIGDSIIFFAAIYNKDQDSLGDTYYKALEKKRKRYSYEFKKQNKSD